MESGANRVGRMTTAGVIAEFPIPSPHSSPGGQENAKQIGRIATGPTGPAHRTGTHERLAVGRAGLDAVRLESPRLSSHTHTISEISPGGGLHRAGPWSFHEAGRQQVEAVAELVAGKTRLDNPEAARFVFVSLSIHTRFPESPGRANRVGRPRPRRQVREPVRAVEGADRDLRARVGRLRVSKAPRTSRASARAQRDATAKDRYLPCVHWRRTHIVAQTANGSAGTTNLVS